MKTFFKKRVITPLAFVFFLAPVIQIVVAALVGEWVGYELKYMILSSDIPCLLSVAVAAWVGKGMKLSEQIALLGYVIALIITVGLCTMALELSGDVFETKEIVEFEYIPVDGQLTVIRGGEEVTFSADQKFEDGGFLLKMSTETGMYSNYFACPKASFDGKCVRLTDSPFAIF
ncbi:hypothetical protein OTK49_21490 [Vibrio coralliirubri]|nr:hypothetical protein [Vibrio coralliirubri]